jgi:class 3 adenylate cyclase/pimeloyl-ACP methyl ester carboxylesterase
MEPQYRFCTSADGTRIAYAFYGSGPPLLFGKGTYQSMDARFTLPEARAYFDALAQHVTLVIFDQRGTGASTRDIEDLSLEAQASDIAAVAEAAGLRRFTLLTEANVSAASAYYIIGHDEEIERFVFWGALGPGTVGHAENARAFREEWSHARRVLAGQIYPEGPVSLQRAFSKGMKDTLSGEMAARRLEALYDVDFDALLSAVAVPALVLNRERVIWPQAKQNTIRVAGLLPHSQLRFVAGKSSTPYPEHEPVVEAVLNFMGLSAPASTIDGTHGTAIILFTDIADSTALTERMGDVAFRDASRALDAGLRAAIRDAGGAAIDGKLLGDGVLATFPSAAQAIDAARRCHALSAASDLRLHFGIHAGDVIREQDNVYGGAVNIASRICGMSAPGEVLVSDVVRGMARSSAGVEFEDRGEHSLKGIEEPVRVYEVRWLSE